MADRKVNGKDVLLFIDPTGGTTYKTVVCLTSNSKKLATATLDAASKCGPDSQPGAQTVSVDFTGQVVVELSTGKVSEADLYTIWANSTKIGWKIGTAVPAEGDVIYTGTGFLSDLSDTYDMNGATFSGTIGVSGLPVQTITPGS